jgi:C-terminal processing protease CtpA/Prc/tetratricopeptide (TPR) repeat protein
MRPFPAALGLTFGLGMAFAMPAFAQDTPNAKEPDTKEPAAKEPATKESAPDLELYRQGSLRYHRGDHADAIRHFAELLEKYPESPRAAEVRFWRASALEESGRRQEALEAYRVLRKLAPKSGWAKDAARRIEHLARSGSPARLECRVQLAKGQPFTAQLHELNSEGVLLSGGEFKTPTRVPFARLVKLEVAGGAKRLLVLSNGDRVSGRFLAVDPEGLVVEAQGIKDPIRVPLARLRELRAPGRASVAWVGTLSEPGLPLPPMMSLGPNSAMAFAIGDEDEPEVERETKVNPDGSRTTTTIDGAGRKTVTTVTRDGKGRKVLIKRGEGDEGATIELKLDGGVVGEALLGDLADELPGDLGEQLGDVDLDLDLEIDDRELRDLDEALRELPKELRERIHRSLRGRNKKRAKKRQRRVWVERGRDGEERVIILEGDERRRTLPSKPAKRIKKKVVVVGGDEEEKVIILEGDGHEHRPGRRVEKRVVIVGGDEDEGPRRKKRVMVFDREGHQVSPGDRVKKHVMVFEGDDEDEVDVDVFVTPDGKKVVRKRIRKGSPKRAFRLGGDEEDVDVFVTPDGKKVVRKRVRVGGKSRTARANDFVFSPNARGDYTKASNVYSWVHDKAMHQTKDRVFLRNGDTLSGKIRSLDSEGMRLDTDYGSVTIRRDQIRQVTFATPKKPFLGVSMKSTARGVEVTHVHDDSAAAVAGLKVGDVIVQVGQKRAKDAAPISVEALGEAINKRRVGEVIHFWVRRGEELKLMEARLAERPVSTRALHVLEGDKALARERAHLELGKLKLADAERARVHAEKLRARAHAELKRAAEGEKRLRKVERKRMTKLEPAKRLEKAKRAGKPRLGVALAEEGGAVKISQVMAGSLAARVGLKAGDRIVKLQGKAVGSISDVAAGMKGLESGAQVSLEVSRRSGNQLRVLQLRFTLE